MSPNTAISTGAAWISAPDRFGQVMRLERELWQRELAAHDVLLAQLGQQAAQGAGGFAPGFGRKAFYVISTSATPLSVFGRIAIRKGNLGVGELAAGWAATLE